MQKAETERLQRERIEQEAREQREKEKEEQERKRKGKRAMNNILFIIIQACIFIILNTTCKLLHSYLWPTSTTFACPCPQRKKRASKGSKKTAR